jgi:hypothetical protein
MEAQSFNSIGVKQSRSGEKARNPTANARNFGAISNWTDNASNDPSRTLGLPKNHEASRLLGENYWFQTNSGTFSIILLLHIIFIYQTKRRKTKKQCLVSYRQLVQQKKCYKGIIAILSHPPPEENVDIRWSASIDFGTIADGDQWMNRIQAWLYLFAQGRWSGLPLLLYISHLLCACRSLEPLFHSSWHYARSVLALAILAMALELFAMYRLLERTSHLLGTESHSTVDFGSIQADSSLGPIVRARSIIQHHTMGTCTALSYAILFLHWSAFPNVALPVLPLLSIPWYPWISYLLCSLILGILSWRHHAATGCLAGTVAGFLWVSGFHFLGELYWSIWWLGWVGIASLLSLKAQHWLTLPGLYVSWDSHGIIRVGGVPVIRSLFRRDLSSQDYAPQARLHEGNHPDECDDEGDLSEESEDDDVSISDLENPLIHGRVPQLNLDADHGLTRRGGRLS